jgi:hypothetical protein
MSMAKYAYYYGGGQAAPAPVVPLIDRVTAWNAGARTLVYSGGENAAFAATGGVGLNTMWFTDTARNIRQPGLIRSISCLFNNILSTQIQFKIYRKNGVNWDFVSNSELITSVDTPTKTFVLATPLVAKPGDTFGIFVNHPQGLNYQAGSAIRYSNDGVNHSDTITTSAALGQSISIKALSNNPYLCATGDSIGMGFPQYAGIYGGGPSGDPSFMPAQKVRESLGDGTLFEYQDFCASGQKFAFVASTGMPAALAMSPNSVLVHCGVNDVFAGTTWASVLSSLATIKALVGTVNLYIDEILPAAVLDDTMSATARQWNTDLAAWCAANGATIIHSHDAMGKIRASTNQLDDLATGYGSDGTHLSATGVAALAACWLAGL